MGREAGGPLSMPAPWTTHRFAHIGAQWEPADESAGKLWPTHGSADIEAREGGAFFELLLFIFLTGFLWHHAPDLSFFFDLCQTSGAWGRIGAPMFLNSF